jgi:hypothetical protein
MKTRFLLLAVVTGAAVGTALAAAQSAAPTFDGLDTNHDGVLSKDEVAAMLPSSKGGGGGRRHFGQGSGPSGAGGFGGHGGGGFGGHGGTMHGQGNSGGTSHGGATRSAGNPPNIDEIFKSWDKDGNGTVSREEFDARPRGGGRRRGAANADDQRAPPSL